jgi:hypothetical protein
MAQASFVYCGQCQKKLQTTLFCRKCNGAFCSLKCYRNHDLAHRLGSESGEINAIQDETKRPTGNQS